MFTPKYRDTHQHDFSSLSFIKEARTGSDGKPVEYIILLRKCACGGSQAVDSGSKEDMRRLYAKLARQLHPDNHPQKQQQHSKNPS